ncbi:MAG TPA: lysophospholipase [Thermotogota bacterium]|nr:lysophospholipase [Thermotogota bacterium]
MKSKECCKEERGKTVVFSFHKENPKGVILIVHGLGEHFGRYETLCREFNEHQFSVYGLDLQGHGQSVGKRGAGRFQVFFRQIGLVLEKIRSKYPSVPIGLFGHSLGGLVSIRFLEENPGEFYCLVASAPAVRLSAENRKKAQGLKPLASLLPFVTLENGIQTPQLSRNPRIVEDYVNDPLVHSRISLGLAWDMFNEGNKAFEKVNTIKIPTLLTFGTEDALVPPEGVKDLFQKLEPAEKHLIAYPGGFHELFFDPEHGEQFRGDIIGWFRRFL